MTENNNITCAFIIHNGRYIVYSLECFLWKKFNLFWQKFKNNTRERKIKFRKVAQLTGVSKTMIGQIERGESSPTLTTIWKIANGLKVSFTSLINNPQPDTKVVLRSDVQALLEDNGRYKVYPSFPFQDDRNFEIYTVEIETEGKLSSEGHKEGTEEFITVFEGN